jgi:hypothetical protein
MPVSQLPARHRAGLCGPLCCRAGRSRCRALIRLHQTGKRSLTAAQETSLGAVEMKGPHLASRFARSEKGRVFRCANAKSEVLLHQRLCEIAAAAGSQRCEWYSGKVWCIAIAAILGPALYPQPSIWTAFECVLTRQAKAGRSSIPNHAFHRNSIAGYPDQVPRILFLALAGRGSSSRLDE